MAAKAAGQPGGKVGEKENGGAEDGTEKSRLPVPTLDEDRERIAEKTDKDGTDGAINAENG
jgi:hypothetical protein